MQTTSYGQLYSVELQKSNLHKSIVLNTVISRLTPRDYIFLTDLLFLRGFSASRKPFFSKGFSFIEVLISLVIVSFLTVLSYQVSITSQNFQENIKTLSKIEQLEQISLSKNWLTKEFLNPFLNSEEDLDLTSSISFCFKRNSDNFRQCHFQELAKSNKNLQFNETTQRWMIQANLSGLVNEINCLDFDGVWIKKTKNCYQYLLPK